ncbi:MAG: hypothetical protein ACSHXF_04740 [Aquaticitalea sp.]
MNDKLEVFYKNQMDIIDPHLQNYNSKISTDKKATNPFLIAVPKDYENFKNSIMIFGQETNFWCRECGKLAEYSHSLKKSIEIYKSFYINGGINKYRGPFWNEFKRIRREVTKSYSAYFIWNNINKIGRMGKGNIREIDLIQFEHFNVVKDEIRVLKPRIIIFLTGHNYDHFIRNNIGDFTQENIGDCIHEIKFIGEFENIKAYKTFHPNALYMKSKNKIVIPNLIHLIKDFCI